MKVYFIFWVVLVICTSVTDFLYIEGSHIYNYHIDMGNDERLRRIIVNCTF